MDVGIGLFKRYQGEGGSAEGGDLPAEFTRAEVAAILKNSYTQGSLAVESSSVDCGS